MKALVLLPLLASLSVAPAFAQKLNLNFDSLAAKATEKTVVSLDGPLLDIVKSKAAQSKPDAAGLFANVDRLSIHNFEFGEGGKYSDADLSSLRSQLTA